MTSKYYDIDDILAESEKIPCRFNLTVPGLGYLEGNPGKSIKKDTKIELPLWLAEVLAICLILDDSDQSFIELAEPDYINSKVINAIKSDPITVDLHTVLPNFYKLVEKWAAMFSEAELISIVMQMLKERAFEINNYASNTNKHLSNTFIYSLDEFEKKLFRITSDSSKEMRKWMNES